MRLVIAGGGTGGHLFPGLALAEELLARGPEHAVLFMGARGGIEERIVPLHNYRLELLPSLKGGFFTVNAPRKAWQGVHGYLQARRAILQFNADAVVGLGGYACALPVMASWGVEIPNMLLEQNVIPGRSNRWLAKFTNEIGVQFLEAARRFPNPRLVKHVGNPLRQKVLAKAAEATQRNTAQELRAEPTVLFLGGSQGAKAINDVAVKVWPKLKQAIPGVRVILISGREDEQRCVQAFAASGVRGQVIPFTEAMEDIYAQADVVVSRAGATAMAEIAAFALPSILVPYPFAADNHQLENAKSFATRGAAVLMNQKGLEVERLGQRVADALLQPERRRKMAMAASAMAVPTAAKDVIDRLLELAAAGRRSATPPAQVVGASSAAEKVA